MTSRSRSHWPVIRCAFAVALFAAAGFLGGCSAGSTVADHLPTALGGLPEGTPQRSNTTSAYPAVHDMPPPRPTTVSTNAERQSSRAILPQPATALRRRPRPLPLPTSRDRRLVAGLLAQHRRAGQRSRAHGRVSPHSAPAALRFLAGQSRQGGGAQCG